MPAAPACAERSKCGPSITRMPTKPAITANQRYMRTRSFRKSADIATVISGDTKEMAVASTMGSRARAAKLQNMPQILMRPRPNCPGAHRAHRRSQFISPGIDHQYRQDRESRAEKHDLPHRIRLTKKPHQRRHHREQQCRHHLECDRLNEIHACIAPVRRTAEASSVGMRLEHVAIAGGSRRGGS